MEWPYSRWERERGVPRGFILHRVTAPGCRAGRQLCIDLVYTMSSDGVRRVDQFGVPVDAVWRIDRPEAASQYVRLTMGSDTLRALLTKATVLDPDGCPYGASPVATTRANLLSLSGAGPAMRVAGGGGVADALEPREPAVHLAWAMGSPSPFCERGALPLWYDARVRGIGQNRPNSGLCWWGAMMFVVTMSESCRKLFVARLPSQAARWCERSLRDSQKAEALRRDIFVRYRVGDDPDQDPRLDGQNGFNQLLELCQAVGVPAGALLQLGGGVRTRSPGHPAPNGRSELLGIRIPRAELSRPQLILTEGGVVWRLCGALMGSLHCGHQTAFVCVGGDHRQWAIHDTDWVTEGVCPMFYRLQEGADWWDELRHQVLVTNRTPSTRFCFVNPNNDHHGDVMTRAARMAGAGPTPDVRPRSRDVEVECIYTRVP